MTIRPITHPLPGEQVVALSPENAAEAAIVWLARPNLFAGRALTAPTLEKRQGWQAGHVALRGQVLTSGVAHGLEVGHEIVKDKGSDTQTVRLTISAGLGIAASGEDVVLPQTVQIDLRGLPVYAELSVEPAGEGAGGGGGGVTPPPPIDPSARGERVRASPVPLAATVRGAIADSVATGRTGPPILTPRRLPAPPADTVENDPSHDGIVLRARAILDRDLGTLYGELPDAIARVGVLVLQPIEVDRLGEFDDTDPCELAPFGEAGDNTSFEDWRIADGVRAVWYAWPGEWRTLPPANARMRNAIAWTIFQAESELEPGELLPWEALGVPIALIALDANLQPQFIDHASVVRRGGRARDPRLSFGATRLHASARLPALWQAQIEQLAEQLASAGEPAPAPDALRAQFALLPPVGLLPTNAIDLTVLPLNQNTETLKSEFFPSPFELDAAPVPLENLDLAIREAAPLAPLDMLAPDRVRVLVPVPQAVYEPRLLHEEIIDPEFDATLQRFLLTRARALGARQGLRQKISELVRLVSARAVPVPAIEADPAALEAESLTPWGPAPTTGGHRSTLTGGLHQHLFTDANPPLAVAPGESLFVWTYLDPDHPPRVLMFQWRVGTSWEHRAYWSIQDDKDLIDLGADGTASRLRMGDLPVLGGWIRLEVPALSVGLGGAAVNGMAFTLYDGQAAYAAAGRLSGASEIAWFSNALPAAAIAPTIGDFLEGWTFLTGNDLNAPFDAPFGLEVIPGKTGPLGGSPDIADLLTDGTLELLAGNPPTTGVLSAPELAQLEKRGLEGFIAFLKSRADRADDLIDYGFVKVQTDTYRVRQLILGTTAATRLAVSPTLATIAQAETAVASQQRISTFFDELKATPKAVQEEDGAPSMRALAAGSGSSGSGTPPKRTPPPKPAPKPAGTISRSTGSGPFVLLPSRQAAVNLQIGAAAKVVSRAPLAYTPKDVVNVLPLVGKATIRTTSIAQRMEQPKALEAKDYATATRFDALQRLLRLADQLRTEDNGVTPGLFAGVNVYGIENDGFLDSADEKTKRFVPFATFITERARVSGVLEVPDREGDESSNFSDSTDVADTTIALLRQMEGRVKLYRDTIDACQRVLDLLRDDITGAGGALAAWEERLAEARHDVAVTRALISEENERLAAINKRRAEVLAKEVRFLAYIRPREVHNLAPTPLRTLDPGLIDAPVPACLAEHADVPDELTDMLSVLREAPVAWFTAVPKLVEKLDRHDIIVKAVQTAQIRSQAFALKPPAPVLTATASALRNAIGFVKARQHAAVLETRQLATAINVSALATLTWQGARAQAEQVVSLGDLIDGEHGRNEVARRAADAFDRMSRVCGCLHAEFSAVLPSIRLDWAESLSQFDEAPSLRDLGVLARWGEIPFIDRKQMQTYVDWLFDQIDARESRADGLMNDVVRMALLLASDAPVGRIIAGRLPRPVVAKPGVRIPLTAFDTSKLRVGMHAVVYKGQDVVARAVVEDIGSEISARVIYTHTTEVSLDTQARVQFAEATQVSVKTTATPTARTARAARL